MTISYTYVGTKEPSTLTVNIAQGSSSINLTTVTGVTLLVRKPDTTEEVSWTTNIVGSTSTTLTVRRSLQSSDLTVAGDYRIMAVLAVPGGQVLAGPASLPVLR